MTEEPSVEGLALPQPNAQEGTQIEEVKPLISKPTHRESQIILEVDQAFNQWLVTKGFNKPRSRDGIWMGYKKGDDADCDSMIYFDQVLKAKYEKEKFQRQKIIDYIRAKRSAKKEEPNGNHPNPISTDHPNPTNPVYGIPQDHATQS
jgi:hypothetical protein